jgi:hypothetical protein
MVADNELDVVTDGESRDNPLVQVFGIVISFVLQQCSRLSCTLLTAVSWSYTIFPMLPESSISIYQYSTDK